jgi:hypothetical protein
LDPKSIFSNCIRNKKTFEIYEISSIRNVVNTLFSTDDIFYAQQRNFKMLIGGGGGTTIHPSTPTPSLLPLVKKIGITSHRISQICIEKFRIISRNLGHFRMLYETKQKTFEIYEISSIRNVVNTLLTTLSLGGKYDIMYKLFLPCGSLVSDIPAGDGNIEMLFFMVH